MAASSRAQVLDLYRAMLRESKHFSAYNYRTYAVRRIRDAFRENKNVKDPVEIQTLVNKAKRDLEIIRRQKFSCCLKSIDLHTAKSVNLFYILILYVSNSLFLETSLSCKLVASV
ncbi:LYR motif-containing protein 4 isoform X2 [Acinonyx jubatus]|uniref:LYR motif-containing protein 4 isoform X2 n=1 Tax=Acinonyx jubatus TaxID=32536 RepID=A0ABM3Q582_ACIJB|nr:LYR motif-containing protein 4 isoform X2 [Acinonyx jubatus]